MSDEFSLTIKFTFDAASMLFYGELPSGARFAIQPNNVSGKLGANLDLLKNFVLREKKGEAPAPHPCVAGNVNSPEVEEFLAKGGVIQKVGVVNKVPKVGTLSLEDLGL